MSVFDDPAFFGEMWADVYDQGTGGPDPAPVVDFLAELAGDERSKMGVPPAEGRGRVLELAVGTGRIALPLSHRGVAVEGVDASDKMVAKLRAKPGGDRIPVVIGDMADVPVTGPYKVAYLVFNTLFNLLDPERQQDCFRNVARVLEPGGAFVVEAYVPNPAHFDQGLGAPKGRVEVLGVTEDSATIEVYSFDAPRQRFISQKITFGPDGVRMIPHAERYCWPAELDLMAERAGLRLAERYGDWHRRPFDNDCMDHVSVYRLP